MSDRGSRDIELVDVFNLRDLGGYAASDGRVVRWRTLFRGAGLHRLAGADLEAVKSLGVVTAIDLRTSGEIAHGVYPVEALGVTFHHLPMIDRVWQLGRAEVAAADAAPEQYLLDRYREMLVDGAEAIAHSVRILSDPGNLPAVFYCAAGKDRTGVLAALILDAIGVRHEEIVADYHLSKDRVDRIRARAARTGRETSMVSQPRAFMQAPALAMELFMASIGSELGGTRAYLRTIGVDDGTVDALREALLESR